MVKWVVDFDCGLFFFNLFIITLIVDFEGGSQSWKPESGTAGNLLFRLGHGRRQLHLHE